MWTCHHQGLERLSGVLLKNFCPEPAVMLYHDQIRRVRQQPRGRVELQLPFIFRNVNRFRL
jgi:hypothetical protein